MKIINILHRSVPISRYAPEVTVLSALNTSIVAVITDQRIGSEPLIGYGFTSFGRFAQDGLIGDRFAPRLLQVDPRTLLHSDGLAIDPIKAWSIMMAGEKAGGHGERPVAVGALDMAIWDLAAKTRGIPLFQLIQRVFSRKTASNKVPAYAGGGYAFPSDEFVCLHDEAQQFRSMGFTATKMKIGAYDLDYDLKRIETVLEVVRDGNNLAVDAMNVYSREQALKVAAVLKPYGLKWFEDICDPLDFETHRELVESYPPPISAGEAIFSAADARNLLRYARLRKGHDVLTFDPAHSYGISEYARIIELFEAEGWTTVDFQAHGGHLFSLHVALGFGLGGCECNPLNFQPFGGFADGAIIVDGEAAPPNLPGIGFESRCLLMDLFRSLIQP